LESSFGYKELVKLLFLLENICNFDEEPKEEPQRATQRNPG
jgi:hypothetical protein